jgi:hypothetical protein
MRLHEPNSFRGFTSFTYTSAASSSTMFINSSNPYKDGNISVTEYERIDGESNKEDMEQTIVVNHDDRRAIVFSQIEFRMIQWAKKLDRSTRTIIRPSIRISILSYSQITIFVF